MYISDIWAVSLLYTLLYVHIHTVILLGNTFNHYHNPFLQLDLFRTQYLAEPWFVGAHKLIIDSD